jgi:uncharacterized protein
MTMPTAAPATLSDRDLERLDTLLETHAVPRDGMSLEMLDGFLSALVVGPEPVGPQEFLATIFNGEPDWATVAEAEDATALVLGLWNDIVARLKVPLGEGDEMHAEAMPLLAYPPLPETDAAVDGQDDDEDPFAGAPDDFPLGAAWALGFLRGVSLRQAAWERLADEYQSIEDDLGMLESLALFSTEQAEELGLEAADIPDLTMRFEMITELPAMLQDIDGLRRGERTPAGDVAGPRPDDPCPCGSGQPFRACCGAPGNLH